LTNRLCNLAEMREGRLLESSGIRDKLAEQCEPVREDRLQAVFLCKDPS